MNSRRNLIKSLGAGALIAGISTVAKGEVSIKGAADLTVKNVATVADLILQKKASVGDIYRTLGYYSENDGGGAHYILRDQRVDSPGNHLLGNGLVAELFVHEALNYKMFGTKSDGNFDDGIAIKATHEYANMYSLPVINRHGEYWIKESNDINIQTSVEWGASVFYIDEQHNTPKAFKFNIVSKAPIKNHQLSESDKRNILAKLIPGVTEIAELNQFRGNLIYVEDKNDRVGYRAGAKFDGQSWAKQELFFIEDHGKVVGDIAYTFKDFSSFEIIPVEDSYLTVTGGCFVLSGNSSGKGYTKNGIAIRRSRTIVSKQIVRLADGAVDNAPNARTGFYNFHKVYEVRLEDIKLIPYEQDREGTERDVPAGTYGISGDRILNGTFRNVTAEGGKVHWGVFGTNMNKNFTIDLCRLNRVDVHFHCWNLRILNTHIGHRGISVTGGGNLTVRDCTVEGRNIINFRQDFGSKWDGDIRVNNILFKPTYPSSVALLELTPSNFNYHYPIVLGKTIIVENVIIDTSSVNKNAEIHLIHFPKFAKMDHDERVIFPSYIEFRNVMCRGHVSGVKGFHLVKPQGFFTDKVGSFDGSLFDANVQVKIDHVDLLDGGSLNNTSNPYHFSMLSNNDQQADAHSLFIDFNLSQAKELQIAVDAVPLQLTLRNSLLSKIDLGAEAKLHGALFLDRCQLAPQVNKAEQVKFDVQSSLGTVFNNCTIHAPRVAAQAEPELFKQYTFLEINKKLLGTHMNTKIANSYLQYLNSKGIKLTSEYSSRLLLGHGIS
ncbi:hypothetical protein GQF61_16140 [Sphingobacterium sp. DK4209]|uniref:Uncharacterized protein n=1 Tax=Sphingobacterium zhuxiongii TaxID=2662364 RepID=A0A5Q0QFI4_9SPHI|nr:MULTISPECIES: hypothetical protein [unclassified Sphingobacterium]MVZ67385.1 hypothetical protein [Sphingobacterium sp. DK4209]QGA26322.1 hypothetical protein GFH32_08270 [Sphingobacterium sp. dk4302]